MARRSLLVIALAGSLTLAACSAQETQPASSTTSVGGQGTKSAAAAGGGSASSTSGASSTAGTQSSQPAEGEPVVTVTPAADAAGVKPNAPVQVSVAGGTLDKVAVTAAGGTALPGAIKDGVWTATSGMAPGTKYTVKTTAVGADGNRHESTSSFTTLRPAVVATYHVLYDQVTVGVGAPVTIQFDSPVQTKQMRAEIEKRAKVTTSPAVEGSWGWLDNRQLMWRPATFWKPGTKVSLKADIQGLQTGDNKFVGKSATGVFTVGPSMISTVDMKAHTMTVTRDGKVLKTIPVSTGKSTEERFVTRSGTKVIIEKNGDITMNSATVGIPEGDPEYYKIDTKYNLRVTWTGEFLHAAPWSIGAQGRANVSHGCTNMSMTNAQWMFDNSRVGDIVKFTGSNRPFLPTDGIGVWEYSFQNWKKQSALAA